jgi:hypothetical protein
MGLEVRCEALLRVLKIKVGNAYTLITDSSAKSHQVLGTWEHLKLKIRMVLSCFRGKTV